MDWHGWGTAGTTESSKWRKRHEDRKKPQAGTARAGTQRRDKPPAQSLAVLVPAGEERGQKARDFQEFFAEEERTGLLRGMRTSR